MRRFTIELEVSAEVTPHEEHAQVPRRAVTDSTLLDQVDWTDGEIQVIGTAEHALIGKTAKVVEAIALEKVGTDHVETVHEKLPRQQAGQPRHCQVIYSSTK